MKLFVITLLLLAHGFSAHAVKALSFEQCVEIVEKNNPGILMAQESLASAKALVGVAQAAYFPEITAELGASQRQESSANTEAYQGALNLSQNLFNGFSDQAQVSAAQARVFSTSADLQIAKAQASYDLKSAFAGLVYAKESVKLADAILKRRSENLALVELLFENGRENKGSVLLSRAHVKQAELDLMKAKDAEFVGESALRKVLGWDDKEALDIKGDVPRINNSTHPDFVSLAEENPERRKAEALVEEAESSLHQAQSGFLPKLNLNASLGQSDSEFWPNNQFATVGVTLSWSLFSGGSDYFERKSAMSLKLAAENKRKNTQLDLVVVLKRSHSDLQQSILQVDVSDGFVQAASVRAEITRKKYNNGLSSFDDWENVENDLITRQKSFIENKKNRVLAEASWEKALGSGSLP